MTEENNEVKKKKSLFKKILKKVKLSHLVLLVVLLAVNSYAWFIYVSQVSSTVDVHVRAWKINFVDGDDAITSYVDVSVENVYPGMTTYEKEIEAYNYGDITANIEYKVLEANIMGTSYVTLEGKNDAGLTPTGTEPTSAQLVSQLENDYPFKIEFDLSSSTISAQNGTATYEITVSWAYESGDDAEDTYWGNRAYDFMEDNPGDPCIELRIKIYIQQATS